MRQTESHSLSVTAYLLQDGWTSRVLSWLLIFLWERKETALSVREIELQINTMTSRWHLTVPVQQIQTLNLNRLFRNATGAYRLCRNAWKNTAFARTAWKLSEYNEDRKVKVSRSSGKVFLFNQTCQIIKPQRSLFANLNLPLQQSLSRLSGGTSFSSATAKITFRNFR